MSHTASVQPAVVPAEEIVTADRRAANAVVAHHAQLADDLDRHVARILEAAERGDVRDVWRARADLLAWLDAELLPHARAEEQALYPAAAARHEGRLLVEGMVDEHRVIMGLVGELSEAETPTRAAATARALAAVFGAHLTKENELIVPLILASGDQSLAALLDGVHALLGAHPQERGEPAGCGCGGCGCAS